MMVYSLKALLVTTTALLASGVSAFSVPTAVKSTVARPASPSDAESHRRSLLLDGAAVLLAAVTTTLPQPALAANKGNSALGAGTVVGREIDTFNSLIYNFKNVDLGGGLDASTLKEPSVPFVEFGEKMKAGALYSRAMEDDDGTIICVCQRVNENEVSIFFL